MVMGSQIVNDHLAFCKKAYYAGFAKVTKFSLNTAFSLACGSATHAAAIDAPAVAIAAAAVEAIMLMLQKLLYNICLLPVHMCHT